MTPDEAIGFKALNCYLTVVGITLGKQKSFVSASDRRVLDQYREVLALSLQEWLEKHPEEPPALRERLRAIHQEVLRFAEVAYHQNLQ